MELMDPATLDILKKMNFKAMANLVSLREIMSEIFVMGKWKAKEFLNLKMVQFMMASIKIIKSMEPGNTIRMAKFMKAIGKMV